NIPLPPPLFATTKLPHHHHYQAPPPPPISTITTQNGVDIVYRLKKQESKSERRNGKHIFVEPDDEDYAIDVNDEPSDDDFVDVGGSSSYGLVT
nr:hypothetical protein [Tanacetum cinerariifolium]